MRINIKKLIYNKPKLLKLSQIFGSYAWQPFFLLLHITLNCNCRCEDCYQQHDSFFSLRANKDISKREFESLIRDVKKSFILMPQFHFYGGEPLVHPEFGSLLNLTKQFNIKSSITTNGYFLDKYIDKILESNVSQVNVSIDDIGERHDKIRQLSGCFKRVIANIKALRGKENKGIKSKRRLININCLILEKNYNHLVDLAKYFIDHHLDIDVLSYQHMYFNPNQAQPNIDIDVLINQMKGLMKLNASFKIVTTPNIELKDVNNFYNKKTTKFKNNCYLPWLGLNILPNLNVTPGGGVLGCKRIVGDLSKESIKEIWQNQDIKQFRKEILKSGLPQICQRCCHKQYY